MATARFADDPAMVCGMARFHGEEVLVLGAQKGRDTKQKVYRNFGLPNPEGYRKALRTMKIAEKFQPPNLHICGCDRRESRTGRRRAWPGGSHRPQFAGNGAAAGSDHYDHYG